MAETAKGGPFQEILDGESSSRPRRPPPRRTSSRSRIKHRHAPSGRNADVPTVDIFVNCIYLSKPIPKFITSDFLAQAGESRRLAVVVDVSCEYVHPLPPIIPSRLLCTLGFLYRHRSTLHHILHHKRLSQD